MQFIDLYGVITWRLKNSIRSSWDFRKLVKEMKKFVGISTPELLPHIVFGYMNVQKDESFVDSFS